MPRSLFDSAEPAAHHATSSLAYLDEARRRHPGMVLLFHAGEQYELFGEDATLAARLLNLELRPGPPPSVRFPTPRLEAHLRKLLQAGHRVAICDQGEEPRRG